MPNISRVHRTWWCIKSYSSCFHRVYVLVGRGKAGNKYEYIL